MYYYIASDATLNILVVGNALLLKMESNGSSWSYMLLLLWFASTAVTAAIYMVMIHGALPEHLV